MRKLLISALAVGALAVGAPSAFAADPTYAGGCSFASVSDPTPGGNLGGQGVFTGEVDWQVVLYDPDPAENPITANVSCELQVNGVVQDSTPVTSVTVAGAGADTLTYNAPNVTDVVELCTVIGAPVSVRDCGTATTTTIPPEEVNDLIADGTAPLDPIICGALKTAGVPAQVNATTGVHGLTMDEDDCDIWGAAGRVIDFVPYDD